MYWYHIIYPIKLGCLHLKINIDLKSKIKIQLIVFCIPIKFYFSIKISYEMTCHSFQSVPDTLVKTERLMKSVNMFQNHKMTLPNGVLFNDSLIHPPEDSSLKSQLLLQLQ